MGELPFVDPDKIDNPSDLNPLRLTRKEWAYLLSALHVEDDEFPGIPENNALIRKIHDALVTQTLPSDDG